MAKKISTQPYKGSRDFFPEDMHFRNWMFDTLRKTAVLYGYQEIDAPIIEPIDIYLSKTSEEIVNTQMYSFTDRGDRKVALRPEMTPTVSRMIAAKFRELPKPIRWFSIPNLWRYEKMGKGRLREHWQLNCDIFASGNSQLADLELISLAIEILIAFGADHQHFGVHLSNREFLNSYLESVVKLEKEKWMIVAQAMDKKSKISDIDFDKILTKAGLNFNQKNAIIEYMESDQILKNFSDLPGAEALLKMLESLKKLGLGNFIHFDPSIIRGFDYYTGMIFEVYDKHPDNNRSLFGGGRYDNLVGLFHKEKIDAVGFGMGDVTLKNFLEIHNLAPNIDKYTEVYVAWIDNYYEYAIKIANQIRKLGIVTELNLERKKLTKQLQEANRKKIKFALIIGENEIKTKTLILKDLNTGEQNPIPIDNIEKILEFKKQ